MEAAVFLIVQEGKFEGLRASQQGFDKCVIKYLVHDVTRGAGPTMPFHQGHSWHKALKLMLATAVDAATANRTLVQPVLCLHTNSRNTCSTYPGAWVDTAGEAF